MNSLLDLPQDKEKLKEILSKDEYTAYTGSGHGSFWDFLKPLFRKLKSLFPDFHVSKGAGDWMTILLLLLLLVLVGFAIYWLCKQLIRQGRVSARPYLPGGEISRSYRYYWEQAREFETSGAWREGVRSVFLTLLFYLEERSLIRVEKWKTNWEYVDEMTGTDPTWIALFRESSLLFEQIWYGKEEVSPDVFTAMYARVAQVLEKEVADRHAKDK
jgi:hypothetical protein